MADNQPTQPTLEDIARAETAADEKREADRKLYAENEARILKEMPIRFFTMARQVREGVARFNGAAKMERAIKYHETASVTVRDPNPAADFVVEVQREPNHCLLALRQMRRLRLPDAFVIEGEGSVGIPDKRERFQMRITALVKDNQITWRIVSGGKQVDTPIDEIGERLVAVVATGELSRLWTAAPFVEKQP